MDPHSNSRKIHEPIYPGDDGGQLQEDTDGQIGSGTSETEAMELDRNNISYFEGKFSSRGEEVPPEVPQDFPGLLEANPRKVSVHSGNKTADILPNIRKNQGTILGKNWIIPAENVDNRSWSAAAGKTKRQMVKSREEPYPLKILGNTSTFPMRSGQLNAKPSSAQSKPPFTSNNPSVVPVKMADKTTQTSSETVPELLSPDSRTKLIKNPIPNFGRRLSIADGMNLFTPTEDNSITQQQGVVNETLNQFRSDAMDEPYDSSQEPIFHDIDLKNDINGTKEVENVVIDSNVFLKNLDLIDEDLIKNSTYYPNGKIYVPFNVHRELDNKTRSSNSDEMKFAARKAKQFLENLSKNNHVKYECQSRDHLKGANSIKIFNSPNVDDRIMQACLYLQSIGKSVHLLTLDTSMRPIARGLGIAISPMVEYLEMTNELAKRLQRRASAPSPEEILKQETAWIMDNLTYEDNKEINNLARRKLAKTRSLDVHKNLCPKPQ